MIAWLDDLADWTGALPVVLVAPAADVAARRALLRALVARVLARPVEAVAIDHAQGRRPLVAAPEAVGLHLSAACRGGLAALAVARTQIGIDVERAGPDEPPWNVLHPREAARLRALPGADRSAAFARLWAAKEAYLKAVRTGLSREPSEIAVDLEDGVPRFLDPQAPAPVRAADLRWRDHRGGRFALAAVLLEALPQAPAPPI